MEDLGNTTEDTRRLTTEEIDALAHDIATHAALIASATYELLDMIRRFDQAKGWVRQGAKDCAAWLSWRIGVGRTAALQQVHVAQRLPEFPLVAEAFRRGEISYSKVRAITRAGMPAEKDELLLHMARGADGAQLERISAAYRRHAPGKSLLDEESRYVRKTFHRDGTVSVTVRVLPDEAERLYVAIRETRRLLTEQAGSAEAHSAESSRPPSPLAEPHAESAAAESTAAESAAAESTAAESTAAESTAADSAAADVHGEESLGAGSHSAESRGAVEGAEIPLPSMADAAMAMVEAHLARLDEAQPPSKAAAEKRQLFIHLREERICGDDAWTAELHDGTPISGDTLKRLACDCGLVVAKTDDQGDPLALGRLSRSVSAALRRALLMRDRCCQFPGCSQLASLESHHIDHWFDLGPTDKLNLTLMCPFHHSCLHEGGFSSQRNDDGSLTVFDPEGRVIAPVPPPVALPDSSAVILRNEATKKGITIGPRTNLVRHNGEGLNLAMAVDALLPIAYKLNAAQRLES